MSLATSPEHFSHSLSPESETTSPAALVGVGGYGDNLVPVWGEGGGEEGGGEGGELEDENESSFFFEKW